MTQKHAIWFIPNYDNRGNATIAHPCSYLRIGSMTSTVDELSTAALRGDDLLERAGITSTTNAFFMDDSAAQNGGVDRNQGGAGTSYFRYDGTAPAPANRNNLTAELMTRGGWRDHTDGNRISTTRGDRLDFVQGNYKRVIFGRVTNTTGEICQSFWDSTGGHNHDSTSTPGEVTTITWVATQGGTWKAIERTVKGNQWERFSGEMTDHWDGGTEKHSFTGKSGGSNSENPVIREETYCKAHNSTTVATSMDSKVYANNNTSKTWLHGWMTSSTTADSISEFSLCALNNGNTHITEHQQTTASKESTRHHFTVVGLTVGLNLVGWDFTQIGPRMVPYPFETPPPMIPAIGISVFLGKTLDVFIGGTVSAEIGVLKGILRVGNSVEGTFGTKTTFKLMYIDGGVKESRVKAAEQRAKLTALRTEANELNAHLADLKGA